MERDRLQQAPTSHIHRFRYSIQDPRVGKPATNSKTQNHHLEKEVGERMDKVTKIPEVGRARQPHAPRAAHTGRMLRSTT